MSSIEKMMHENLANQGKLIFIYLYISIISQFLMVRLIIMSEKYPITRQEFTIRIKRKSVILQLNEVLQSNLKKHCVKYKYIANMSNQQISALK
ncbi:hypothetical protein H6F47_05260 [Sphaerospermopsis sp. FACHB-1094]|uniref:hypothetical protein n=1 Tax=Sphaerospermopsis sp. FACHB-1094 TaxID=2692861 RepID=UPI00168411ED|nr:hypothetical protein [Sphaerospermopsis sp. FACHB-1094]MBD2131871.1 hypothetical protein [Sphaerospermopsis sp. FACHB-1094]